jgi:hypothetical protein
LVRRLLPRLALVLSLRLSLRWSLRRPLMLPLWLVPLLFLLLFRFLSFLVLGFVWGRRRVPRWGLRLALIRVLPALLVGVWIDVRRSCGRLRVLVYLPAIFRRGGLCKPVKGV